MSSQPTTAASKISNPYLKTKAQKQTDDEKGGAQLSEQFRTSGDVITMVPIGASTFSQAFSTIDDTEYFRKEIGSAKDLGILDLDVQAQLEQRSFDTAAAKDEAERLLARDNHALLQPHVLYVSTKQRGNGILKFIRNVPFAYSKMLPDYIMSSQRCALFLSTKYHALYPNYIHYRIAELKTDFKLRILLVLVDVDDNANILLFLNRLAVVHNLTLILAWSEEEAARYLETYKAFDGKDATSIQKREQSDFVDQAVDFLTTVRSVNKTDSTQLLAQFNSLKQIVAASEDELSLCPGLGEKKVKRLWDAFHKPFSSKQAKRRKLEQDAKANKLGDNQLEDCNISHDQTTSG